MREYIAFYPFVTQPGSYINTMKMFIESKYQVVDYNDAKAGFYSLFSIRTIYLNWLEDKLNENDVTFIRRAKWFGVRIVWVFHNKISHDTQDRDRAISNITFLAKHADRIVLHSRKSEKYIREYIPRIKSGKLVYIEHPDFIGDYCSFSSLENEIRTNSDTYIFGCYGLVRPYKNLELLINAFKKMSKEYNCRLLIAGRAINALYGNTIKEMCNEDERITFVEKHIHSLEMGSYLEMADVLVLPYNLKSSMNSGVMIMAASYKKTFIVPNIAMADDFNDELIYKYSYDNDEKHVDILKEVMEKAYSDGKDLCRDKGEKIYQVIKDEYNKQKVKEKILCVI